MTIRQLDRFLDAIADRCFGACPSASQKAVFLVVMFATVGLIGYFGAKLWVLLVLSVFPRPGVVAWCCEAAPLAFCVFSLAWDIIRRPPVRSRQIVPVAGTIPPPPLGRGQ